MKLKNKSIMLNPGEFRKFDLPEYARTLTVQRIDNGTFVVVSFDSGYISVKVNNR